MDASTTVVEAFDPAAMLRLIEGDHQALTAVAGEVGQLLRGALVQIAEQAGPMMEEH